MLCKKVGKILALAFVALIVITGKSHSETTQYVPEGFVLGGGLDQLEALFYDTTQPQQQVIIVQMIVATTNENRFDVLMDIVMEDLKGAETYGQVNNTAPEARRTALKTLAETGNIDYSDEYLTILQYDSDQETRLTAAEALGEIKDDTMVPVLTSLLKTIYNHSDFDEGEDDMYADDLVAEAIIKAMGAHGHPGYFTALLEVVTLRNHRDETIDAAWDAMAKLQW